MRVYFNESNSRKLSQRECMASYVWLGVVSIACVALALGHFIQ
jgi:hypothetical protein